MHDSTAAEIRRPITFWEDDRWVGKKDLSLALIISRIVAEGPPRILEVGVWEGGWSLHVAMNTGATSSTGIDPYPGLADVREATKRRFVAHGVALDLFESWAETDPMRRYDLAHVDGEHSEQAAYADLVNAAAVLSPEGVIIVDDWIEPTYLGVNSAMHSFLRDHDFLPVAVTESKAYLVTARRARALRSALEREFGATPQIPVVRSVAPGLGGYGESRSILGFEPLLCLGKPTGDLIVSGGVPDDEPSFAARWRRSLRDRMSASRTTLTRAESG